MPPLSNKTLSLNGRKGKEERRRREEWRKDYIYIAENYVTIKRN